MYNATEQFAELNKASVAQATKLAAIAIENAEKLARLNLSAAKVVLAQGVEGATATASVKDVQDLLALRAKYAETGVQTAMAYSKSLYEFASEAQAQYSALAEEAWSALLEGRRVVGREGQQGRAGRFGRRLQRAPFDGCRDDRRVRPVPKGDEASREPG